ncbi:hypothetical protein IAR55_000403 [Kwoniella newhampshirensis]|uniref:Calcium channel n=1 Tax=Kwoniella newhampshirensis TaxID=1651941 RepID=A0AAW0Z740_9TREE
MLVMGLDTSDAPILSERSCQGKRKGHRRSGTRVTDSKVHRPASQRHRTRSKRVIPNRYSIFRLSLINFLSLLLLVWLPGALGQETTPSSASSSSTISTLALSRSTTLTSSGTSSASTSSATSARVLSLNNLPTTLSLPPVNSTSPLLQLSFPSTASLVLTFSICSLSSNTSLLPTILVSTAGTDPPTFDLGTRSISDSASGGVRGSSQGYNRRSGRSGTTWSVSWDKGFGNWTWTGTGETEVDVLIGLGLGTDGTTMAPLDLTGGVVIQLGASSRSSIHSLTASMPLLGDTLSTQALIFSPLLYSSPQSQPSYPNYTLPSSQLVFPDFDSQSTTINTTLSTNLTLILVPTTSSPTNDGLDNSLCAVTNAAASTGQVASEENMIFQTSEMRWTSMGREEGFRRYWVVGGLVAEGNYTAWIRDNQGVLSRPIWFATKDESFPCQLVLPTTLCPSIAYAAPLPVNSTPATSPSGAILSNNSPIQVLPDDLTDLLTTNLEAFSTSLLSQACGRDLYSHVSSCMDCFTTYRSWLCRIVIPQCGPTNTSLSASSSSSTSSSTTSTSAETYPSPSTIHRSWSNSRNPEQLAPEYEFEELLPCLATCNEVDRTCPVNMGFRCPRRGVNAARSYAFKGTNNKFGNGGGGAQGWEGADRWGRRWCNG